MEKYKFNLLHCIYILAFIHCVILVLKCGVQWDYDSISYIQAWETISNGQIDLWRTPVYPVCIGVANSIFGSRYQLTVSIIQHVIFLISIRYFYKITQQIVKSEKIVLSATAFYALYPCISTWNCFILTEPFAVYSMIFTIYSAVSAYQKNSIFHILVFTFWVVFQIFLRPAQIYILPVFIMGWFLLYLRQKQFTRIILGGIIGTCLASVCMFLYIWSFHRAYGLYTPCAVGVVNQYYMARRGGALLPGDIKDAEFRKYVAERDKIFQNGEGTFVDLFTEAVDAVNLFGLKHVADVVSNSEHSTTTLHTKMVFQRLRTASNDRVFTTYIRKWNSVTDIIGPHLNAVYLLIGIYAFCLFLWIKCKRECPWISTTLFMLGTSHIAIIIIACQNVWGRLVLPVTPIYLIMFAQLCQVCCEMPRNGFARMQKGLL